MISIIRLSLIVSAALLEALAFLEKSEWSPKIALRQSQIDQVS